MKILILSWKDISHPQKGGAEVVLWNYALELKKIGHKVTWLSSKYANTKETSIIDGIKVLRLGTINTIYFKIGGYYKKYLQNNFDIIIDQAGGPPLFSPLYAKKQAKVFFIHHISDLEWEYKFPFPLSKIFKFLYNRALSLYKNEETITVSNSTKKELVEAFGFHDKKVHTIENALDIKDTPIPSIEGKNDSILFFGRLTPLKRVEHAILAFSIFLKNHPHYVLNIVGPTPDKKYFESLQKLVSTLKLEEKVTFVGNISLENRSSIQHNKMLLVPSHKEGFGLVVLEANVFGIPALGYKVGGIRDSIKDGINGYKVDDGDYQSMANKLSEILSDETQYAALVESSYTHVISRDDFSKNTKKLEKILMSKI